MENRQDIVPTEPLEPDTIMDYLEKGSDAIQGDNYAIFLRDVMLAGMEIFSKVLDKACQDKKVRADIFAKLSKGFHQVMESNDTLASQAIQSIQSNLETLHRILQDEKTSPEDFKICLLQMREYSDEIVRITKETQDRNERILSRYQDAEEVFEKKSDTGSISPFAIGAVGIGIVGIGITCFALKSKDKE